MNHFLKKKGKFVIFGQGRSGSTLLKQLLHSHPAINCDGELLNVKDNYITNPFALRLAYKFPIRFFNFRSRISKNELYGFTLLFYQYYPQRYLLEKLHNNGWRVIHITRENDFLQSISHFVARQTNLWHRTHEHSDHLQKVLIDPNEFLSWIKLLAKNKATENEIFKNLDHFRVVYENDLQQEDLWPNITSRIFEFLNTCQAPVSAGIKKTYARPYSEIVENYDGLLLFLKKNNVSLNI